MNYIIWPSIPAFSIEKTILQSYRFKKLQDPSKISLIKNIVEAYGKHEVSFRRLHIQRVIWLSSLIGIWISLIISGGFGLAYLNSEIRKDAPQVFLYWRIGIYSFLILSFLLLIANHFLKKRLIKSITDVEEKKDMVINAILNQ